MLSLRSRQVVAIHPLYLNSAMGNMSLPTSSCGRRASALTSQESWTACYGGRGCPAPHVWPGHSTYVPHAHPPPATLYCAPSLLAVILLRLLVSWSGAVHSDYVLVLAFSSESEKLVY
jgi:hypothetical protein